MVERNRSTLEAVVDRFRNNNTLDYLRLLQLGKSIRDLSRFVGSQGQNIDVLQFSF